MNSQPDPVEAEATGQSHVVASYQGHDFKVPRDPDDWPLDLIAVSVGISVAGNLIIDRGATGRAMKLLLGDQWPAFMKAFPRSRDLTVSSQEFASAVGLPARDSNDKVFGALPRLLATLDTRRDAVEATLIQAGLDYRDRWRFDADGHRKLTLRRIYVALKHAPPDSALGISENNGKMPHTATDILLMDLFEAITKTVHPSRPMSSEQKAQRSNPQDKVADAVADYRKRHAKTPRETQREDAVSTATANARARKAAASARSQ